MQHILKTVAARMVRHVFLQTTPLRSSSSAAPLRLSSALRNSAAPIFSHKPAPINRPDARRFGSGGGSGGVLEEVEVEAVVVEVEEAVLEVEAAVASGLPTWHF